MILIDKMTTRYVEREDRIALTGQGGSSCTVRLWLIRPLVQKLVGALVDGVKSGHADARYADLIDSFAQTQAEERREPATAVEYVPDATRSGGASGQENHAAPESAPGGSSPAGGQEWLVTGANLKVVNGKYVLTFFGDEDRKAGFMLTEEHLRQWLGILRTACLAGGWTSQDWPEWMRTATVPHGDPSSMH